MDKKRERERKREANTPTHIGYAEHTPVNET
jgi:hypothetical protein